MSEERRIGYEELQAALRDIKRKLEKLEQIMEGNGKIGMIGKVIIMWKVMPWIVTIVILGEIISQDAWAKILPMIFGGM